MEWLVENKMLIVFTVGVVALIGLVIYTVAGNVPDSEMIKNWSIQEAIFYGFGMLAFATLVSR